MAVSLEISKCKDCPHLEIGQSYSLDGFDRGSDWSCGKSRRLLVSFVEWKRDEPKEIPQWCPLRK